MKVAIIFGSISDKEVMAKAARCLEEFGVFYEAYAISAHRLPEVLGEKLKEFEHNGVEVIIAGAGLAAHLPGVVASKTTIPVVGVPLKGALEGVDALYSIVQMPKDIPVATVGINNARNGAFLALQILGVKYPEIKEKVAKYRKEMVAKLTEEINQTL
ncbi:5-(carboxyamino)imidazole ribonucleotide mutase [Balneicella halophila]|uniref:N5-carboxyaminoimidazole ribonucleotide mutase n=1 Tax=Balneicella halophila TaxID=1537566 RepID=A0A7L4URK6_BALHA|nr:5-(carboxyamino)imidazole ribonucleotide mutase [Balneicella halophila]PVX52380.1 5-(carboxyamino)imidazole ribonucleotide mutase [Balneicella halophila]